MELTWYGRTCVRIRGKDAVVVNDPFQSVVGPTGRGITGDVVTFSHGDDRPLPRAKGKTSRDGKTHLPSSLDDAFVLDGPGEYEVKEVLITGVRTYRDDARGAEAGKQVTFVVEVDGVHTIHLGDIGHLLSEEKLGDIGSVDIACVPLGGTLSPAQAAALVAQLDPKIVVPMPICDDDADCADALKRFFHEMGAEPITQPKLDGHRVEPPIRDDHGPPRVARQAGLTEAGSPAPGARGPAAGGGGALRSRHIPCSLTFRLSGGVRDLRRRIRSGTTGTPGATTVIPPRSRGRTEGETPIGPVAADLRQQIRLAGISAGGTRRRACRQTRLPASLSRGRGPCGRA